MDGPADCFGAGVDRALQRLLCGQAPPLPELPIQYADYALWQRERLSGAPMERQLAYWQTHLAGAPGLLELPSDRPRPPIAELSGRGKTPWTSL